MADDFSNASKDLQEMIREIIRATSTTNRLVSKLGTASDSPDLRAKLKETPQSVKPIAIQASADLKQLKRIAKADQQQVVAKLERELTKAVKDFETVSKKSISQQRAIAYVHHDEDDEGQEEDSLLRHPESQEMQVQARNHDLEWNEHVALSRQEEIEEIEQTVVEVFDIFRDLGVMVEDQGRQLDTAHDAIERGQAHMAAGNDQLGEATRRAIRNRRLKCWILLFALLAMLIIILYVSL
eukprot:Sspe_Gene.48841::Locus_25779_Transcript_2_3_Confidence_0.400_Length_1237::g.48841::m.48841